MTHEFLFVLWSAARAHEREIADAIAKRFRVIVVEDPSPVWRRDRDTYGHELVVDANVYDLKKSFRSLTGRSNVVHSSVTADETAHQLAALSSPSNDPIPFRAMCYPDDERIRLVRRRADALRLADHRTAILLEFARNRGRSGDQPFHRGERGALRLCSHVRLGRAPRAARLPRPQARRGTKWPNSVFCGRSPLKGGCRSCDSCLIMEA